MSYSSVYMKNVAKHKAAPLLDTESGSLASLIEPGLPGQDSKTGRRHEDVMFCWV